MKHKDEPSIVVMHPGASYAYQVALAAQEGGMLTRLITGLYYKAASFPYSLVNKLPTRLRSSAIRELKRRQMEGIESRLVDTLEWLELSKVIMLRAAIFRSLLRLEHVDIITRYSNLFDWYASHLIPQTSENVLVAFQGGALQSLRKAKRARLISILDQACALNAQLIVEEEYRRQGLPQRGQRSNVKQLIAEVHLADQITAPSEFVVNSLLEVGVAREKIAVIPWGVDVDRFRPLASEDSARPFTVLYVGELSLRKGVHYLLEAWRQLQLENARLLLMGSVVDEGAQVLLNRYEGLYERIANVPHHELHRYYHQCDVFVLPTLAEGSALVSYEAMASGLPCVVTESAGSVVRDRVDGLVIPPRDAGALRRTILELRDSAELRVTLGRAARSRAEEFTWTRYRARVRDVYREAWEKGREERENDRKHGSHIKTNATLSRSVDQS